MAAAEGQKPVWMGAKKKKHTGQTLPPCIKSDLSQPVKEMLKREEEFLRPQGLINHALMDIWVKDFFPFLGNESLLKHEGENEKFLGFLLTERSIPQIAPIYELGREHKNCCERKPINEGGQRPVKHAESQGSYRCRIYPQTQTTRAPLKMHARKRPPLALVPSISRPPREVPAINRPPAKMAGLLYHVEPTPPKHKPFSRQREREREKEGSGCARVSPFPIENNRIPFFFSF